MGKGRWIALGGLAALVATPGVAHAASARVSVTFSGTDTQTWSVAQGRNCARFGSGGQVVHFAAIHPTVAVLGEARVRGRTHLIFKLGGGRTRGALIMRAHGTVARTDNTEFAPPESEDSFPCPVRPKDCRTTALGDGGPLDEQPGAPRFFLFTDGRRLRPQGDYWDSRDGPWTNCLGFWTPVGLREDGGPLWRGPEFGNQVLESGANGQPAAVGPRIFPGTLHRGRAYRFRYSVRYTLTLTSARFPKNDFETNGIEDPDQFGGVELVGGPKTVSHVVAWVVTVRRVP
jgi:hypothetical protein